MLDILFENDEKARIHYYIVEGDYFLRRIKALYTAFNISFDEKKPNSFIGKRGVVVTKLDDNAYDGRKRVKVSHVRSIKPDDKQAKNQQNSRQYREEYTESSGENSHNNREYYSHDDIPF